MRRVVLSLVPILALMMAPMQPALLAQLGDIQVTLTCSDGITITETSLVVDLETLTDLKSAVEGMTLYPAGLICRLTEAPLASGFVAVAFADGPKDMAVGGLQIGGTCYTANLGFSAFSNADGTAPYGGANAEKIPQREGIPPRHYKTKGTCLESPTDSKTANLAGDIQEASGFYGPGGLGCGANGCDYVLLTVRDNGNPIAGVSPDQIGGQAYSGTNPGCTPQPLQSVGIVVNGNIVVKDRQP